MQKRGRLCEKGKSAYIFAYLWRKKKKALKRNTTNLIQVTSREGRLGKTHRDRFCKPF